MGTKKDNSESNKITINQINHRSDFNSACSLEWIETNGLGGYSSCTVSGANTRRYHGLLVAAMNPPVGRVVVLSKLDESIITDAGRFELSSNQYPGTIHPQGFNYLQSFQRDLFPEFEFVAGEIRLRKTVVAVQGENTTVVLYEVLAADKKFKMEFLPLCSARDFHYTTHANNAINTGYKFLDGVFQTKNYHGSPDLFISVPGSQFEPAQHWYHDFEFVREEERGLDFNEDLFSHGKFIVELNKGDRVGIIISVEDPGGRDAFSLYSDERKQRTSYVKQFSWNENVRRLALAADQFIVNRGEKLKTIIAGYHWFGDWGRDTMIALPGLCLATGRPAEAKKILLEFTSFLSEGMLPNRFPELGEAPEYNTADATLWFFYSIYKYYQLTSDLAFITQLIPALKEIISWHDKGTRYNIHVDSDGLLYAGAEGVQLTWMDAKVGDWVVTPRRGKPVEINALWFNALSVMSTLLAAIGNAKESADFGKRAEAVRDQFVKSFWDAKGGYLCDYIDGEHRNSDLRPNQLYALSLPFQLLPRDKAAKVFKAVTSHLMTSRGLRSLSPDHMDYQPVCAGSLWARDRAYHQGTVWSFLLGPYIDALIKVKGQNGRVEARRILDLFFDHLSEAGVGTVSEIFDGQPPHTPRGCIAQAWGVGEILRVSLEYDLFPQGENDDA
jgi:predicted glycogen debranching enzyme